jgi:hypothetical protein
MVTGQASASLAFKRSLGFIFINPAIGRNAAKEGGEELE